jgi:hypothetical protein
MAAQNQQAQSQSLIDLEQQKLQSELQVIQAKMQAKIQEETVLSDLRMKEKQFEIMTKTQGAIEEIKTEAYLQQETGTEITGSVRKK